MFRIFGAAKPVAPVAAPVKIDVDAHKAGMEQNMQSLQAKIQNADQQLAGIREQLRRAPPAQQAIIKQQAAGILRNRAMWMKQAQTTSAKVANLDQMSFARQNALDARVQIDAMKQTGAELAAAQSDLPDIDDIADLQYDINEQLRDADEMNDVLSQAFDVGNIDDAALEAELASFDDQLAAVPDAPVAYDPHAMAGGAQAMGGMGMGMGMGGGWGAGGAYPMAPAGYPSAPMVAPHAPAAQPVAHQRAGALGEEMFGGR